MVGKVSDSFGRFTWRTFAGGQVIGWQFGQKNVERPDVTIRSTSALQRRQGNPSR